MSSLNTEKKELKKVLTLEEKKSDLIQQLQISIERTSELRGALSLLDVLIKEDNDNL